MSSEAIDSPWKSSFFVDTANANSADYTNRSKQLLDTLDEIGIQTASPKSGAAVVDDWPKPREGPDLYGGSSGLVVNELGSPRVTLPGIHNILTPIPLTPTGLWVGRNLTGLNSWMLPVFSPLLPTSLSPTVLSPLITTNVSPVCSLYDNSTISSASFGNVTALVNSGGRSTCDAVKNNCGRNIAEPCDLQIACNDVPTLTSCGVSSNITPQRACSSRIESSVKLSMPPKYIKRRGRPKKTEGMLMHEYDQFLGNCDMEADYLPMDPALTKGQSRQEPFKFRTPNGKGRVRKGSDFKSTASQNARNVNHHIWLDQRDAVEDTLADIGFQVLQTDTGEYGCNLCDAKYTRRMFLLRHAQRCHVQLKPYHCKECGVRCARVDTLLRHVKRFHKTATKVDP